MRLYRSPPASCHEPHSAGSSQQRAQRRPATSAADQPHAGRGDGGAHFVVCQRRRADVPGTCPHRQSGPSVGAVTAHRASNRPPLPPPPPRPPARPHHLRSARPSRPAGGCTGPAPACPGVRRLVNTVTPGGDSAAIPMTSWPALGTTAVLCAPESGAVAAHWAATREIDGMDAAASRFDPGSELSRLNRAPRRWVGVSERLHDALRLAVRAATITNGAVDLAMSACATSASGHALRGSATMMPAPSRAPASRISRRVSLTVTMFETSIHPLARLSRTGQPGLTSAGRPEGARLCSMSHGYARALADWFHVAR
jgi:hypothetical protein